MSYEVVGVGRRSNKYEMRCCMESRYHFSKPKLSFMRYIFTFSLGNIFLYLLLSWRYIAADQVIFNWHLGFFLVLQFIGFFGLFSCITNLIPFLVCRLFTRSKVVLSFVNVITASLGAFLILLDSGVYKIFHFHMNGAIIHMIFSSAFSQIFEFSWLEWLIFISAFIGIVLLQVVWSIVCWKRAYSKASAKPSVIFFIFILLSYSTSQAWHAYADITSDSNILRHAQILPLYFGLTVKRYALAHDWITNQQILDYQKNAHIIDMNTSSHSATMHYPLHRLHIQHVKHPLNVLIIGIDAWRHDAMTKSITPHIYSYAQHAVQFTDHFSGGDCTQPGLFTLFYGIPSSYWQITSDHNIPPLLLSTMRKQGYAMGIYVSATLVQPPFYRNIFYGIPELHMTTPGSSPWQRDESITKEEIQFLAKHSQDHKPFFSFMFYDSVHGYDFPQSSKKPFKPWWHTVDHMALNNNFNPLPYRNRYNNSAYFVDGLVNRVLSTLDHNGLSKNTVVIITTDHGEEFNDNHKNYWGHGSNFSHPQIKIPFIVYWPGIKPAVVTYKTSHFDVVPTLMQDILGVTNPMKDYSVGHSLWQKKPEPFYVEGSYSTTAIVTNNRIMTLYPGGFSKTTDNHLHSASMIDPHTLMQATQLMRLYYK